MGNHARCAQVRYYLWRGSKSYESATQVSTRPWQNRRRWSSKSSSKTIIDIAGEPARSVLRYRFLTVTGTRRWTNGAARARRLVDRDAINEDKFIREVDRPATQRSESRCRADRLFPPTVASPR